MTASSSKNFLNSPNVNFPSLSLSDFELSEIWTPYIFNSLSLSEPLLSLSAFSKYTVSTLGWLIFTLNSPSSRPLLFLSAFVYAKTSMFGALNAFSNSSLVTFPSDLPFLP